MFGGLFKLAMKPVPSLQMENTNMCTELLACGIHQIRENACTVYFIYKNVYLINLLLLLLNHILLYFQLSEKRHIL